MGSDFIIPVSASRSPDVECFQCRRVVPITESAEIQLTDKTPQKALGGGTTKLYACRSCFDTMLAGTK